MDMSETFVLQISETLLQLQIIHNKTQKTVEEDIVPGGKAGVCEKRDGLSARPDYRVIPCQINQWFASHPSDFDEIWHTCR